VAWNCPSLRWNHNHHLAGTIMVNNLFNFNSLEGFIHIDNPPIGLLIY
jgi:hypothetical protein